MPDSEDFDRVANALCEVTLAIEDVDLNPMLDDDVVELVEHKQALSEMCRGYRHDQHTARRYEEEEAED